MSDELSCYDGKKTLCDSLNYMRRNRPLLTKEVRGTGN